MFPFIYTANSHLSWPNSALSVSLSNPPPISYSLSQKFHFSSSKRMHHWVHWWKIQELISITFCYLFHLLHSVWCKTKAFVSFVWKVNSTALTYLWSSYHVTNVWFSEDVNKLSTGKKQTLTNTWNGQLGELYCSNLQILSFVNNMSIYLTRPHFALLIVMVICLSENKLQRLSSNETILPTL